MRSWKRVVVTGMRLVSVSSFLLPFWYPVARFSEMDQVARATLGNIPIVLYRKNDTTRQVVVHSDVCPHMGGSLGRGGWINPENSNLVCPYHGFEFDEGRFAGLPSLSSLRPVARKRSTTRIGALPLLPVLVRNNHVYVSLDNQLLSLPYFPPEHDDPTFCVISGTREVDCPVDSLVENLLDMLHISFVHSFGNRDSPLAANISYQKTSDISGKTTFYYEPNRATISRILGTDSSVVVENEFFLPTTTLTRVRAGGIIKTVFTQSLPVSETKTILFWSVYRNFWRDPFLPLFDRLGDSLMRFLMERTIDEDASILSRAYPDAREGFLTRYDITIRKFRETRDHIKKSMNDA